jgi:hypothetical protein
MGKSVLLSRINMMRLWLRNTDVNYYQCIGPVSSEEQELLQLFEGEKFPGSLRSLNQNWRHHTL